MWKGAGGATDARSALDDALQVLSGLHWRHAIEAIERAQAEFWIFPEILRRAGVAPGSDA
jgi:hypothetical protein